MAKKGQRFNSYSDELKDEIVKAYFDNQGGVKSLSKKYGISYHSIQNWIDKRNNLDKYITGKKIGRPKDSQIDYKERYEILKKYQAFLMAQRERK